MSRSHISIHIRRKVFEAAGGRCGYCLTDQTFTAMPLFIEHIVPIAAGGTDDEENLWYSCPYCNNHKAAKTFAIDPESGDECPLFNPRTQSWSEHFEWSVDGREIIGRTPIGRATVVALHLNAKQFLQARRRWVLAGWHLPVTK